MKIIKVTKYNISIAYRTKCIIAHFVQLLVYCMYTEGIKTGYGGVCCHNAWGRVQNRKSNPAAPRPRDLTYCSHNPECIVTTNPDRSALITIITWHFSFHLVNVSNLHVQNAASRVTWYIQWIWSLPNVPYLPTIATPCPLEFGVCLCLILPED